MLRAIRRRRPRVSRTYLGGVRWPFGVVVAIGSTLLVTACGSASPGGAAHTRASRQSVTVVTQTIVDRSPTGATHTLAALVKTTRSGIVRITTSGCGTQDVGTGFLVGRDLVATAEHVIDDASSIRLAQGGKVRATGVVIGDDPARDVALVRANKPLSGYVFHLASQTPALGGSVAALGFPLGLPLTVTQGAVSGLGRTVPIDGIARHSLIQTDAAVNPGNSGGPLLSVSNGTVVGLVDLGTTQANGIAFAVSAKVARPLIQAWEASPQTTPALACGSQPSVASPPRLAASSPEQTTTTPTPAGVSQGSVTALDSYWNDISDGEYAAAFGYLAPGAVNVSKAQFESNEQKAGISGVTFSAQLASSTPTTATVDVTELRTVDAEYGCRDWTGSYEMSFQRNSWLIDRSNIAPRACN